MASKSGQEATSTQQIEELLDAVDSTLDRLKTLYEQYFLGIQKQAPGYLHSDVERKLRDLTQMNLRNTRLRYRLATLQQKFGSYNSYWRRTLRQIENGTYIRNLAKIGREAARTGSEIPEEILAAMPKRMREQVLRDRDAAIALAKRRMQLEEGGAGDEDLLTLADEPPAAPAAPARAERKTTAGAHVLHEDEGDIDFNALFSAFEDDAPKLDTSTTQAITQPLARPRTPSVPMPAGAGAGPATGAIPRPVAQSPSGPVQTGPVPRPTPPGVPAPTGATGAIPRPMAQSPSGPVQTGPVPRPTPPGVPAPATGAIPRPMAQSPSGPVQSATGATGAIPRPTAQSPSGPAQTGPVPRPTPPGVSAPTGASASRPTPSSTPRPGDPAVTQPLPRPQPPRPAPSQQSRPNPVAPGAAAQTGPVPVESMSGPFPRAPSEKPAARTTQPVPRPAAPLKPPPGMTEADVNALHAKYVKAKEMVGEKVDPGSREKLLRTINQTAPKIMEQYKASGVDFSVVVKDNQVVIKAKPKT